MTKGTYRVRFLVAFICALVVVYLLWIGSQYVIEGKVVLECVDNVIAIALALYIARDVMAIDTKLRLAEQRCHQSQQQRKR